jgi:nucleotide-binding universal stress UspA family protein
MIRSILVPLDGSAFGEHALPLALNIANCTGASLKLLHVLQPVIRAVPEMLVYEEPLDAEYRQQIRSYLDKVCGQLRAFSRVAVSAEIPGGEIIPTIRSAVSDSKTDLVVMTTHGRGPLGRFWLGSVADQLVRELPVPLLLVRPDRKEPDLTREMLCKRILVPLDGTPLAEQIIPSTLDLARAFGAEVQLLRVVESDTPLDIAYQYRGAMVTQHVRRMIDELERLQERRKEEALRYLEAVSIRFRNEGVRAVTRVVEDAHAATVLLREAEEVDLVAVATHGYSGLKRLWIGSVADKVIRGSAIPVLVQKPKQ